MLASAATRAADRRRSSRVSCTTRTASAIVKTRDTIVMVKRTVVMVMAVATQLALPEFHGHFNEHVDGSTEATRR
jgi:hypothetical protein